MSRIVVLDDSVTILTLLDTWLQKEGHTVKTFPTPTGLFKAIPYLQPPPDLLIIDIELNHLSLDGYDVIQTIRSSPGYKVIPILVISSRDANLDIVRAKLVGAQEYLIKPFTVQEFMSLIRRMLSQRGKQT